MKWSLDIKKNKTSPFFLLSSAPSVVTRCCHVTYILQQWFIPFYPFCPFQGKTCGTFDYTPQAGHTPFLFLFVFKLVQAHRCVSKTPLLTPRCDPWLPEVPPNQPGATWKLLVFPLSQLFQLQLLCASLLPVLPHTCPVPRMGCGSCHCSGKPKVEKDWEPLQLGGGADAPLVSFWPFLQDTGGVSYYDTCPLYFSDSLQRHHSTFPINLLLPLP